MEHVKGIIQKSIKNNKNGEKTVRPIDRLKAILNAQSVQEQFRAVLKENAEAFVASLIDLYNTDTMLQACDPKDVVAEALKAASLKLSINKQLGFAWIVPFYNKKLKKYVPAFQLGYKGYIQLCMRTGAYRYINADAVYEGELVKKDKLTGEIVLDPEKRISDKVVGYFAFIETINGFRKSFYMTTEEIIEHAKRFSKSYGSKDSPWTTDFDSMAMKTVLRLLLSKYGIMSTEMQKAYIADTAPDEEMLQLQKEDAGDVIDIKAEVKEEEAPEPQPQPEKMETAAAQATQAEKIKEKDTEKELEAEEEVADVGTIESELLKNQISLDDLDGMGDIDDVGGIEDIEDLENIPKDEYPIE